MPGDTLELHREHKLRGTYHHLNGQTQTTSVKVEVQRANRHCRLGYPATIDIELRGLPPAIAAAVLDLLGEEATN